MWIANDKCTSINVYVNTQSGVGSSNNIISFFVGTIRWRERNQWKGLFHSQVINRPN